MIVNLEGLDVCPRPSLAQHAERSSRSSVASAATRQWYAYGLMGWALQIEQFLGDALLRSSWVERLGRISFLGALDYQPLSRAADSRLDHSLAVTELGVGIARALDLSVATQRLVGAACLLHDIGHFPMSHAAEAGFRAAFSADHHQLSEWIILGNGPISEKRSLAPILRDCGLEPGEVWALICGRQSSSSGVAASLFGGVINLDTFDGILRSAHSFGWCPDVVPANPFTILKGDLSISRAALPRIDSFWRLKSCVYEEIINRPSNIILELELSRRVESLIKPDIIEQFENFHDAMFRERIGFDRPRQDILRELDEVLILSPNQETHGSSVERTVKRYQVDIKVEGIAECLSFSDWPRRYQHYRQKMFLVRRNGSGAISLPEPTSLGFEK